MISKMNRKIILLTLFLSCFLLFMIPPVRANNGEVLSSNEATISPTIDGFLDDEWNDSYHNLITLVGVEDISPVDLYIKNDQFQINISSNINNKISIQEKREIKFKTYAVTRIRGSIFDELRSIDWLPRSVRQKAKEIERIEVEDKPAKENASYSHDYLKPADETASTQENQEVEH